MFGQRQDGDDDLPGIAPEPSQPISTPQTASQPLSAATSPAEPAKKYTHTAYMTRLALQVGFSQQDLDENSPEVIHAEIQAIRSHQQQQRQQYSPPLASGGRPAAGGQPATLPVEQAPPAEDPFDQIEKNTDQFDPTYVAMAKKIKAQEAALKRLDALEQRENARVKQTVGEAIEAAMETLPEAVVGRGPLASLPENLQTVRKRIYANAGVNQSVDSPRVITQKITAAYAAFYGHLNIGTAAAPDPAAAAYEANGHAANGKPKPVPQQDPATGRFVKPLENGTRSRLTEADWQNGQVARPTARAGAAEPRGIHAAKAKAADHYRAQGLDPGPLSEEGEDDDLPG